jgi:predicted transcriptional regulator
LIVKHKKQQRFSKCDYLTLVETLSTSNIEIGFVDSSQIHQSQNQNTIVAIKTRKKTHKQTTTANTVVEQSSAANSQQSLTSLATLLSFDDVNRFASISRSRSSTSLSTTRGTKRNI